MFLHVTVSVSLAEESSDWKQTNTAAIAAMRAEKYEDAEKLFQKALSECKFSADKKIVETNLAVLLRKMERHSEADKLDPPHQPETGLNLNTGSSAKIPSTSESNKLPSTMHQAEIHQNSGYDYNLALRDLESQIKKADAADDLETLQGLFQKKADLLYQRDKSYTLDYAFALHFRSQVLKHMHKDAEADSLEFKAVQIRNANRQIMSSIPYRPIQPISTPPSKLLGLNYAFDTTPPRNSQSEEHYSSSSNPRAWTPGSSMSSGTSTPSAGSVFQGYKFGK